MDETYPCKAPQRIFRARTNRSSTRPTHRLPRAGLPKTRGAEVSAFAATATRQPRVTARTKPPAAPKPTARAAANPSTRPAAGPSARPAAGPSAKSAARSATGKSAAKQPRRTPAETFAAAMEIKAARPDVTEADLAAELGISASRWRTIRRELTTGDDLRLAA